MNEQRSNMGMKTMNANRLSFYRFEELAMLPIVLYVVLSGVLMIGFHYYSMKVLIIAALIALLAGFLLCINKKEYWNAIVRGLAQYGNARLILIFVVIGVFSKLLVNGNIGGGFIWISLHLGLQGGLFVVFTFLGCAVISMGAGAPIAALLAVIPIFYPAGVMMGANPSVLVGSMLSGIFFGDALSPSSQVIHTTIASQHDAATGKSADLLETMKERLPYLLAAGLLSILLFYLFGGTGQSSVDMTQAAALADVKGLWMMLPIVILLVICFKTSDLFVGVTYAILSGVLIGLLTGVFQLQDMFLIDYETQQLHGIFFDGISAVTDIILSTILLYGLIQIAVDGGMMKKCCDFILSREITKTASGAEQILAIGIGVVNILLAGCVLPSILMFKDVADTVGQKAGISASRRSIILTAMSTNVTAIIPINSAFVMGAVTVIQQMVSKNALLPIITPFQIFTSSYYCLILTGICILWVVCGAGRKKIKKHHRTMVDAKEW